MAFIAIELKNLQKIKGLLKVNMRSVRDDLVRELALHLSEGSTEKLDERIYSRPPSPHYRRTGRALRGRSNKKQGTGKRLVTRDTRLAGAQKNYVPFLNRNRRIRRFNTLFWEDSIEDTKKFAKKAGNKALRKAFKNRLKR